MTATEFAAKCRAAAENYHTVYMKGAFGAPVTQKIIDRLARLYPSWYTEKKQKELAALIGTDTFGFDCVCFIKGILWGWDGDLNAIYGGAVYESNGVPDFSVSGMAAYCTDISESFDRLAAGEVVSMPGHVGVYIGDGLCAECTVSYGGGVLLSACNRKKEGYPTRVWSWHGKLRFVDYPAEQTEASLPVLGACDTGSAVEALQALLNLRLGTDLRIDGILGSVTAEALTRFRKQIGLSSEPIADRSVWEGLIAP